ncbi:MAG TPA: hypothetical protein VE641_09490 [Chthoniobacterales bacterium]|nr:hypothetical protein [Chthoniobacterales bacterium]
MKTERRVSLENINVTAEPLVPRRRPPSCREVSNTRTGGEHRGSGDGMSAKEQVVNTGNPIRWEERSQPELREEQAGPGSGGGEVRSSNEASNDRGAKGPQFKGNAEVVRARRLM